MTYEYTYQAGVTLVTALKVLGLFLMLVWTELIVASAIRDREQR